MGVQQAPSSRMAARVFKLFTMSAPFLNSARSPVPDWSNA
jgi:hypothetical protein